jgi:hypothetical protein
MKNRMKREFPSIKEITLSDGSHVYDIILGNMTVSVCSFKEALDMWYALNDILSSALDVTFNNKRDDVGMDRWSDTWAG